MFPWWFIAILSDNKSFIRVTLLATLFEIVHLYGRLLDSFFSRLEAFITSSNTNDYATFVVRNINDNTVSAQGYLLTTSSLLIAIAIVGLGQ